jgi:hypothetical protein
LDAYLTVRVDFLVVLFIFEETVLIYYSASGGVQISAFSESSFFFGCGCGRSTLGVGTGVGAGAGEAIGVGTDAGPG